jgi:hypothetical protein
MTGRWFEFEPSRLNFLNISVLFMRYFETSRGLSKRVKFNGLCLLVDFCEAEKGGHLKSSHPAGRQ